MKIDHLLEMDAPWLHIVVETPSAAYDAAWALHREGRGRIASRVLYGTKMRTWQTLFDEVGAALQFPPYFGENLNALHDCLTDLEWLEADAYVLTILVAARVLEEEDDKSKRVFWEQLRDAAKDWSVEGSVACPPKPFRVIAQCSAEEESKLRRRMESLR